MDGLGGNMLIGLVGITGVGKSYLRQQAMQSIGELRYLFAATTRQPFEGEVDGVDKYFLSNQEFIAKEMSGEMFLVQEIYGFRYGFMKKDLNPNICYITELLHTDIHQMEQQIEVKSIYIYTNDTSRLFTNLKAIHKDDNILRGRIERDKLRKKELERQHQKGLFTCSFENKYDGKSVNDFVSLVQSIRENYS